ncbi:hypothetical protein, partial [Paenibacillus illinoisensis]|uniref:hypothetical protein n=1 Tax=Paenibacillus illinoisensis TaxID=59845 RepID=UPI0036F23BCC
TTAQTEQSSSENNRDRNTSSSYASESRGALDLGLNAKAEGESATMAQTEQRSSENDRDRNTSSSSYA